MFSDALLKVSDVNAIRREESGSELKCDFWVRPDGRMCIQHLRLGRIRFLPAAHAFGIPYFDLPCGSGLENADGCCPSHRAGRIDDRQLRRGTCQRRFGRWQGVRGSLPDVGPPCSCQPVGGRGLAPAAGPRQSGVSRQGRLARHRVVRPGHGAGVAASRGGASHRPGGFGDARSWWRPCGPGRGRASSAARWIGRRGCRGTISCGPMSSCAGAARTASAWSNRASSSAPARNGSRACSARRRTSARRVFTRMLLERSRGLLQEPALSVKEIGDRLGFKTSSHFIVAFRREFGTTPLEYRRTCLCFHGCL